MTSGVSKRKLTTIMAADVVGYSRLVAADDEAAIRRLQQLREIVESIVARHDGRSFGAAGDSLMTEFPSSVEAVRCALEIQEEIAARNADAPAERAMFFRIGINIGDVLVEDDSLYGDGVNVAARLQEIADPGGIVLSAAAYDQIKNKVTVDIEPLGQHSLKNIPEPVTIFRVRGIQGAPTRPAAAASRARAGWKRRAMTAAAAIVVVIGAFAAWDQLIEPQRRFEAFKAQAAQPVPAQPSIIVMPFLNVSEDEAQEYFCLGMAEDIMTSLTKVSGVFVVGRDSAMSFKGKNVQAKQIGRTLGVRYVLQGSVRRADNRVRVSTHLVDAATDQTVWAARYDRELGNIFAIQDDITDRIVHSLSVTFRPGERDNVRQQIAQLPSSYDLFLQGRVKLIPPHRENLAEAEKLFKEVIRLDPSFSGGHAGLALVYALRVSLGYVRSPDAAAVDVNMAESLAGTALANDRRATMGMHALARALLLKSQPDRAVEYAQRAYDIQPGDAYTASSLALILAFAGKPHEAYYPLERAMERERVPEYRARTLFIKMVAAYEAGDYAIVDEAYSALVKAGVQCPLNCLAYAAASKLHVAGSVRDDQERQRLTAEARDIAAKLRTDHPDYEARLAPWFRLFKNGGQELKRDMEKVYGLL